MTTRIAPRTWMHEQIDRRQRALLDRLEAEICRYLNAGYRIDQLARYTLPSGHEIISPRSGEMPFTEAIV